MPCHLFYGRRTRANDQAAIGFGPAVSRGPRTIANVSQKRYATPMKSTTIPPVRIEPQFREEIEQALEEGETLAALVEKAVRNEVAFRRDHAEFVRRGLAAIKRSTEAGDGIPAATVISKLRAKVSEARKRKAGTS